MTSTLPARTQARYRGVIYGIDVIDHASFMAGAPVVVLNDYVGKTRQRGRGRENQHRDKQPFSDLIVGSPRILWEGICTEDELDEMERRFIQDAEVRPRLNIDLNEDNPRMIPKAVQRAQRLQREPGWVPLEQRRRESLLEWSEQPVRVPTTHPGSRVSEPDGWCVRHPIGVKVCLWLTTWWATAGLAWGLLTRHGLLPDVLVRATVVAAGGLALLVWALLRPVDTVKGWRARRRVWAKRVRKVRRLAR